MKDVDATIIAVVAAVMETVFSEIIPAVVFSGSSAWCACVETMDVVITADAAMAIPAGSLSYCFCSAADVEIMDVAADISRAEVSSSAFFWVLTCDCCMTPEQNESGQTASVCWCSQDRFHKKHFHLWPEFPFSFSFKYILYYKIIYSMSNERLLS